MPGVTDVLDMTVVDELIALSDDGDPELLLDLIELFLSDSPGKLDSVAKGVQSGDLERVERAAHSLKGSSGNLGARRLQHLCESLVGRSRTGDLEGARRVATQLESVFDEARAALLRLQAQFV